MNAGNYQSNLDYYVSVVRNFYTNVVEYTYTNEILKFLQSNNIKPTDDIKNYVISIIIAAQLQSSCMTMVFFYFSLYLF